MRRFLRHVFRHRFIRADDLYRLLPNRSRDKLSRRLTRLFRAGYADRPIAQVDRFREGGSQALVYGLGTKGAQVLKELYDLRPKSRDWTTRNRSYTRENLDHTLAVTRFMVDLELACRSRADVELISFEGILAGAPEAARKRVQPNRWPVPVQWAAHSAEVILAPDAIFGLRGTQKDDRTVRTFAFLEVDRGTMTISPARQLRERESFLYRSSILRKMLTYAHSHRHGLHHDLGIPIARVLMLTTSAARAEVMRRAAEALVVRPAGLPAGLFLFGVQDDFANPLTATWLDTLGATQTIGPSSPALV